jgi:hypothetical protein
MQLMRSVAALTAGSQPLVSTCRRNLQGSNNIAGVIDSGGATIGATIAKRNTRCIPR